MPDILVVKKEQNEYTLVETQKEELCTSTGGSSSHITIQKINYELIRNGYYKFNSPDVLPYNGWDCTPLLDMTDKTYIAINIGTRNMWQYTYVGGGILSQAIGDFVYNGETFYIFDVSSVSVFGTSEATNKMNNLIIYNVLSYNIQQPIIEEVE